MPFSKIIPPSPSPTKSKRLFYTSVSLLLMRPKIKENFLKVSSGYYSNTQHQTRKWLRDLLCHPPRSRWTCLSKCPLGHTIYPTLQITPQTAKYKESNKNVCFWELGKGATTLNPNQGQWLTEGPQDNPDNQEVRLMLTFKLGLIPQGFHGPASQHHYWWACHDWRGDWPFLLGRSTGGKLSVSEGPAEVMKSLLLFLCLSISLSILQSLTLLLRSLHILFLCFLDILYFGKLHIQLTQA